MACTRARGGRRLRRRSCCGRCCCKRWYGKRSERLLMEDLDYSLLFRWFVGLAIDDEVWDATVFSKNRERLIEGEVERGFSRQCGDNWRARDCWAMSTSRWMGRCWRHGRTGAVFGRNPTRRSGAAEVGASGCCGTRMNRPPTRRRDCFANAMRQRRNRVTWGTCSPINQHGLIVEACVTEAGTRAEREAALSLLDRRAPGRRRTLGGRQAIPRTTFCRGSA
jgi:hypothetical protein